MTRLIKSSFLWQFAGGFAIGAVALFSLTPTPVDAYPAAPSEVAQVR